MTENEKMIFELLDEYANALNDKEVSAAKSKIKKEITNMLLDDLISQGYKQDKAEAIVGFVTRDAKKEVDYSAILGKFGGNTVVDKISGLPLKELYNGYLIYDKYNDDIETLITNCCKLKKQLDENGKYDYEGQKALVEMFNSFLNITVNSLSVQPLATNAYKTYISFCGAKSSELMDFFIDYSNISGIRTIIYTRPNDIELPLDFDNILHGKSGWINGPSLDEMESLYNGEYGFFTEEELKLFEPYLSWRYMYEVEQELLANGINPEDYYNMMEDLYGVGKEDKKDSPANKFTKWLMEKYPDLGPKCVEIGESISGFFGKKEYHAVEPNHSSDLSIANLRRVKKRYNAARITKYDPLILDLDGDGYNVETKELGANFDLDKNGFAEKINWTSRDGFLCLDLNGSGTIDDGGELFGDQTLLADGTTAKNGFEALAQYDSNGDAVWVLTFFGINKPKF